MAVVCLIQEYENYLTYVYMSLHYCAGFQPILICDTSKKTRQRLQSLCLEDLFTFVKNYIIFYALPLLMAHHPPHEGSMEVAGGAAT